MRRAGVALVVALAAASSCSKKEIVDPSTPDLAAGSHAQDEFQPLREKWEHADRETRLGLEPALVRHVKVFPKDPTARVASAMLALIAAAKHDSERAADLAAPLVAGPPGETRDMALVAKGAALREGGHPAEALAILGPLFGKLLDPFARDTLNEEAALAAIDTKHFGDGVRFARGWLAQADAPDKDAILKSVVALLDRVPADPLLDLVRSVKGTDEMNGELLHRVGERLAGLAISTKNVALAKLLVAEARPVLGDKEDEVERIAARGASIRLEHNTVGLLLSLRNEETQRRGLEVSSGLALALGLPGSPARVVTRDDQGDTQKVDEAMALLNADGAAVIIAGIDTAEANKAREYADQTGVPLILLRPPVRPLSPGGPVFLLGEDPAEVRGALVGALADQGKSRIAILGGTRDDGAMPKAAPGADIVGFSPCGASLDFVSVQKANGLVVDGSPMCIRDAVSGVPAGVALALGLDAPGDIAGKIEARAGIYPPSPTAKPGDADLEAYFAEGRGGPSWWAGLGHDAGKLAWTAVSRLPDDSPNDESAIAARKALATKLLASSTAKLWTTDASGFAGGRVIARDIVVR